MSKDLKHLQKICESGAVNLADSLADWAMSKEEDMMKLSLKAIHRAKHENDPLAGLAVLGIVKVLEVITLRLDDLEKN